MGMSSDRSFARELLSMGRRFAADLTRSIVSRHADENYDAGFDEAAHICKNVLAEVIDGLMAKMKSGTLSKQEQALYARLTELAAEMDERLWSTRVAEPTGDNPPQPAGTRPRQ
ncbi:hypothetical protein [Streptomyces sp. NRRL B-24572]|uniref:hypothetical protein n=1 Tax=Streptomyces sp. NRRL B-24572 TaxID=1962156 RepID=UPI000A3D55EA|nr:hypothetical protein [Streptomyces sp. NRRL B-24572]